MKIKISLLSVLVLLSASLAFLFFSLCLSAEDLNLNSVVSGNNQFAFDLYSRYRSENGNVFFSPYSISSALVMAYEGARGKTADEIQAVFHFPKDDSLRRASFLKIYNRMNSKEESTSSGTVDVLPDEKKYPFMKDYIAEKEKYTGEKYSKGNNKTYELRIANALWAQKDYPLLKDYMTLTEEYYQGKVTNLDFIKDSENSRVTINNWIEEQTNKKIRNLIPEGMLNNQTRLVITNAIYFKGSWAKQFDKKDTQEKDFRVTSGETVKVKMMSLAGEDARFNYTENEELQILELPYAGETLSMLILLPRKSNLDSLEKSLNVEKLSAWRNSLSMEQVEISLPRFKFETKYFMASTLKEMGMSTAFSGDADFSGMTGGKDVYIDEVIHQAYVEVNEEGTEAAAATAVAMITSSMVEEPSPIKIFNADHPFIFVIQEKETGNILFLGRVTNPTTA